MSELEWYPADWVDESCPPSKPSLGAFIIAKEDGGYQLGYAPGEKEIDQEDRDTFHQSLAIGDVVNFITCERLGEVEVTLRRDGSFELHGAIPAGHNTVIINGDVDTLQESFDAIIEEIKNPADRRFFNLAGLIFEEGSDAERVELSFANWSDLLPHLFEIEDGKPVFRPVPPLIDRN